jgi:hypothetical protein
MSFYFFFDAFFVFLAAFFFVAIMLTTFRAVRDLSVAHPWHRVPDRSGKLTRIGSWDPERRHRKMTIDSY